MTTPASVLLRYTKYDGSLHWHFPVERLGEDEHGCWLFGRKGILLRRGAEVALEQPHHFVGLVPHVGDWTAFWNDGHEVEIYVDVTSTPQWNGDEVTMVDLDLDVVRWREGNVEVLDEDEFEEHQVRYGYPVDVIESAARTCQWLVGAITERCEPFGDVGRRWLSYGLT